MYYDTEYIIRNQLLPLKTVASQSPHARIISSCHLPRAYPMFYGEVFSVLSHGIERSDTLFPKLTYLELNYLTRETPPWPVPGSLSGHQMVQMLQRRVDLIDGIHIECGQSSLDTELGQ